MGWIAIRARDVYGFIGYIDDNENIITISDEQKEWLEEHYEEFNADKQGYVDKILDDGRIER